MIMEEDRLGGDANWEQKEQWKTTARHTIQRPRVKLTKQSPKLIIQKPKHIKQDPTLVDKTNISNKSDN